MITIRKPYERERLAFATTGESLTHKSMAAECDINQIMLKWQKTGVIEHRNTFQGQYSDFTNTPTDYQEAMNQVLEADEMFSSLPSSVRKRFANDPANFLEFVGDPTNIPEMIKLGLATPNTDFDDVIEKPKKASPNTSPKEAKKPSGEDPDE